MVHFTGAVQRTHKSTKILSHDASQGRCCLVDTANTEGGKRLKQSTNSISFGHRHA